MTDHSAKKRIRLSVALKPALGSMFQPTGFPDLGAAIFHAYRQDGNAPVRSLLVESVQSMANRLEATAWDAGIQRPVDLVAPLPYVRVHHADAPDTFITSSRLESHRLTSPFIRTATLDGATMADIFTERLGLANDRPLHYPRMAEALMDLDPFVLIHGVFFNQSQWFGQPRFTRAVSSVIEAYDVQPAPSGGLKRDVVRHSTGKNTAGEADEEQGIEDGPSGGGASEGYGAVPFQRTEWTAREIRVMFSVDTELLASYGLGPQRTELLTTLALWEIRTFLDGGMRLRTACDLEPVDERDIDGQIEPAEKLAERVAELLPHAPAGGPLTVLWKDTSGKKEKKPKGTTAKAGSK